VPFFDEHGKLTHRLIAQRGKMAGGLQHLQGVALVYFSGSDPELIVQKLLTDEATWDEKKETLTGRGEIVVATEENRLSGEGFDFALATSLLHIHRKFKMENRELLLTSRRATIELIVERSGENVKVRDVKRCEAIDDLHIAVQPTAKKTYPFEKASSDLAIYDGLAETITFPRPIRYLRQGREAVSNTLTIDLKKPATDH
jgi:hypothetical protein